VKKKKPIVTTLRQSLSYTPAELAFGTSGLRGLVNDITSLETYVNTRGFLAWLLETGQVARGSSVFVAGDLRPSTAHRVAEQGLRGEILQAVCRAIQDAGLAAGNLGRVPTPALAAYALSRAAPCIMVTGSHISFDRNGIKFYTPKGELLKGDEVPLLAHVAHVRAEEYARPFDGSIFDEQGMLRPEAEHPLPEESTEAAEEYRRRYAAAFPAGALAGRRILVWQHSAVGRDLLAAILTDLGASVTAAGRSDQFVPVDTEAVSDEMLQRIQGLVDAQDGIEAVVSTDGDGDRPLLLAVENGRVQFVPGDLMGLITAGFLGVKHIAVPVSVNDAVEAFARENQVGFASTRIGSPFVIQAMKEVGWEGNGGFLTAVELAVPGGAVLSPLPTRDAVLPLLAVLCASLGKGITVSALLGALPRRFGTTGLLQEFPLARGREIVQWLSPHDTGVLSARFDPTGITARGTDGTERLLGASDPLREELAAIHGRAGRYFTAEGGFPELVRCSWQDGVRLRFANNDVAHLRPSGNSPEMRWYANADTPERARAIGEAGVSPRGILRAMERDAAERIAVAGLRALPRAVTLLPAVQRYPWGGTDFIPGLLGVQNPDHGPYAEMWMGAHGRAPAEADLEGTRIPLDRLVAADPWLILGPDVALHFAGRLPYLFKVLDVRAMASLQAHPTKGQAEEGFSRENAAGVPLDAPERNYRDDNHKPEVQVVLTDFWMLHGFRPLEEIADVLAAEGELLRLMPDFEQRLRAAGREPGARAGLLRELYARVMTMAQGEADALIDPLVARWTQEEERGALGRDSHAFWALRAARSFALPGGGRDRGIIAMFLLNLLRLRPGQGSYQPAGTLHAYLEGVNVELMASSDNVLRGGLTGKHIDIPELLATLDFHDGRPALLEGRAASETGREYETPAEEFALERIEIAQGTPYSGGREHSADSLIVIEGAASVIAGGRALPLARGGSALVPAGLAYSIAARSPRAVLFKAGVPQRSYT
jgi:phosphomannomutase